ncbi:septum site-determining protein Ssd [Haloechinothrix sp. LS1_15]|uniref:septum site-determining protein Ssd n=1 Tax=Haloechinothrix sp. LS1_15 TaxID=2652248 RepID=UPI00294408C8|nr:septum site-determining protein Ssd [Haloechinothrix sp. LS1_15]MDV6011357.1 helicase [Haloechinothrix sp. LS1_15]
MTDVRSDTASGSDTGAVSRPLVVVDDEDQLDQVLRLAASVGCELERAVDLDAARSRFRDAPLLILDEAALPRCLTRQVMPGTSGPPGAAGTSRAEGTVVLICRDEPSPETWQQAFRVGAEQVLRLPDDESCLVAVLADAADGPGAGDGTVVAVVGGRGGAGASVLSSAVALTACHTGRDALLVDCDALAGGIDLVLGAELDSGSRWPELNLGSGRVSMRALRDALPRFSHDGGELAVLSCGRDGGGPSEDGVAAVLEAGRRAGRTVVCDLPRRPDPACRRVVELADLVCVVIPAEVRACTSAQQVLGWLRELTDRLGLVVRGPAPEALPAQEIADVLELPLVTAMRAEPRLAAALERGQFRPRPRGPLATGARAVLCALPEASGEYGAA